MIETILTAMGGGAITGLITVVTMRNDVNWIKMFIAKLETRVEFLERNI